VISELKEYDFPKQSEEETPRQGARNILSSYSQVYDVLAESLQNAVDAVDERHAQDPTTATARLSIEFDISQRSVTITDTGTGISWDMLQNAPAPNITQKREENSPTASHQRSRGERG
jgi:nitrogen fixation/metabolism regulation signal transduction histidine kinase